MIPFVSGGISAEPVAIFNSQTSRPTTRSPGHGSRTPRRLHLMGGPLTVFDEGENGTGYVGDALIDDTEPGQTRLISYALDLAIDAHAEDGAGSGTVVAMTITQGRPAHHPSGGRVPQSTHSRTTVRRLRRLWSSIPIGVTIGNCWNLQRPRKRRRAVLRFDVPVAAKASHSSSRCKRGQHPDLRDLRTAGHRPGHAAGVHPQRRGQRVGQGVFAGSRSPVAKRSPRPRQSSPNLNARIDAISQGQTRIRDNMKALDHSSALYKSLRHRVELDAQETNLESLQAQK